MSTTHFFWMVLLMTYSTNILSSFCGLLIHVHDPSQSITLALQQLVLLNFVFSHSNFSICAVKASTGIEFLSGSPFLKKLCMLVYHFLFYHVAGKTVYICLSYLLSNLFFLSFYWFLEFKTFARIYVYLFSSIKPVIWYAFSICRLKLRESF